MAHKIPCSELNDALQAARDRSDECWAFADTMQYGATFAGISAAVACSAIIPTIGGPFGLGGGTVARDKLIKTCLAGTGGFLGGLRKLNTILDNCNALDLDGVAAANRWLACYNDHKKYLDSRLQPNT